MVHHAQLATQSQEKTRKFYPEQTVPMPQSESAAEVGNEPQILTRGLRLCAKHRL